MSKKTNGGHEAMLVVLSAVKAILASSENPAAEPIDQKRLTQLTAETRFCLEDEAQRVVEAGLAHIATTHPELCGPNAPTLIANAMSAMGSPLLQELRTNAKAGDDIDVANVLKSLGDAPPTVAMASASAAVQDDDADEDGIDVPFDDKLLNPSVVKSMNIMVQRATHDQIKDAQTLFKRLARAETKVAEIKASTRAHKAAVESGSAPGDAAGAIWTSETVELGKILDQSDIGGDANIVGALLKKQVKTWTCNVRHPAIPKVDPDYMFDASALAKALYAIDTGENLAFVGPPGCGKTTITKQLAARLGRPFYRIPIDGEMRRTEIIGGFKQVADERGSRTQWFDGLLTKGITEPSIIDLDEIDRGDPDLLYAAHAVLEREGISILEDAGRHVHMHPGCSILATANTKGRADANGLYASVNEMSVATHDRIAFWHDCDYQSEGDEALMLQRKVPGLHPDDAKKIAKLAANLRQVFKNGHIRTSFSARNTLAVARYTVFLANTNMSRTALKDAVKAVFASRAVDEADAAAIGENIGMLGL